jgi:hypothetical protein
MPDDASPEPDQLRLLADAAAAALARGAKPSSVRELAQRLLRDPKAAERAGVLLGEALSLYASRGEP